MKKKKTEKRMMVFPDNRLFNYLRSGKFEALSDDWKHAKLPLRFDYELIVMTEGTLYLKYMDEEFTVDKGEYLILPPSDSIREGFKKAYCSFYWIHFTAEFTRKKNHLTKKQNASSCRSLPRFHDQRKLPCR